MDQLRRTRSVDNLVNFDENNQIYRNPDREDLPEDQSLLDRSSLAAVSNRYETGNNTQTMREYIPPILPERNEFRKLTKPNKVVVQIQKFDGQDDKDTIKKWFKRYDLMALTNNWDENIKRNQLLFNLKMEPERYCFDLITENPDICYNELKEKMCNLFTNTENSSTDFQDLLDRKLRRGENLHTYWCDKLELINKVDPDMNFKLKSDHIISGLDSDLYKDVRRIKNITPPNCLEQLFKIMRDQYEINRSAKSQKEMNQKTVRFEEKKPWRNEREQKWQGRTSFPGNNRNYQRNDNRGNYNRNENRGNFNRGFNNGRQNEWHNSNQVQTDFVSSGSQNLDNSGNYRTDLKPRNYNNRFSTPPNNINPRNNYSRPSQDVRQTVNQPSRPKRPSHTPSGDPICFNCNKPGHMSFSCPEKRSQTPKDLN